MSNKYVPTNRTPNLKNIKKITLNSKIKDIHSLNLVCNKINIIKHYGLEGSKVF